MKLPFHRLVTAQRQQAIEETRAAGRLGAVQIPPAALSAIHDPSDSLILQLNDALLEGQDERAQKLRGQAYTQWLRDNVERLTEAFEDTGLKDGGPWLRQQFLLETGIEL